LLTKTGPTSNYAAALAAIIGVKGIPLSELGYDIRKPGFRVDPITFTSVPVDQNDPRGSHCGAGAPRFNIVIGEYVYFVGCNSPSPDMDTPGNGWQRLRWGTTTDLSASPQCSGGFLRTGQRQPMHSFNASHGLLQYKGADGDSIEIVFDEGDDTGPDNFCFAILDNIDMNTTLVGRGPQENKDEDEAQGEDGKGDTFHSDDSPSHPESSSLSYEDRSQGMKMQSVNGARSITYNGGCVSFVTDAIQNGKPGYVATFLACDLSQLLGAGIGTFSISVAGPPGYLYQKSAALTSGYVSIHPH